MAIYSELWFMRIILAKDKGSKKISRGMELDWSIKYRMMNASLQQDVSISG